MAHVNFCASLLGVLSNKMSPYDELFKINLKIYYLNPWKMDYEEIHVDRLVDVAS